MSYAHSGRTRRKITQELIRCPCVEQIHGQLLVCNALVWKKPEELRQHLLDHRPRQVVERLTDQEILDWFIPAKIIRQEGIPHDDKD